MCAIFCWTGTNQHEIYKLLIDTLNIEADHRFLLVRLQCNYLCEGASQAHFNQTCLLSIQFYYSLIYTWRSKIPKEQKNHFYKNLLFKRWKINVNIHWTKTNQTPGEYMRLKDTHREEVYIDTKITHCQKEGETWYIGGRCNLHKVGKYWCRKCRNPMFTTRKWQQENWICTEL